MDRLLCEGYLGVAQAAAGFSDGAERFADAVTAFRQIAEADEHRRDDALYFVQQLEHVRRLYTG